MTEFQKYCGVNISLQHGIHHEPQKYVECIRQIGAQWVRLEIDWYSPIDKDYLISFVKELQQNNIKILGVLMGLVPGTARNVFIKNKKYRSPFLYIEEYLEFVREYVQLLRHYISHWEIWNEENAYRFWRRPPKPQEYGTILKEAKKTIQMIDTEAKIVFGGIVGNDIQKFCGIEQGFFKQLHTKQVAQEADYYAIHPYTIDSYIPTGRSSKQLIAAIQKNIIAFQEKYPDRPLMITEYGINSLLSRYSDKTIGKIYKELLKFCQKRKIVIFFWMLVDFKIKGYAFLNPEQKFGLFTTKLEAKDSVRTLQ